MYRWLLCWRYLRTRYIALASVVSVTLGVATMIIVNAVMDGFTTEMQGRMHGILSDVIVESHGSSGMLNHQFFEQRIREVVGDDLEGLTTVVHVPAMLTISHRGEPITRQINLIGIDKESYASVSDFSKYLMHPENQRLLSFNLHETGYAPDREGFPEAGWKHRRRAAAAQKRINEIQHQIQIEKDRNAELRKQIDQVVTGSSDGATSTSAAADSRFVMPTLPGAEVEAPVAVGSSLETKSNSAIASDTTPPPTFNSVSTSEADQAHIFDPEREQHDGIVMGISIGSTRYRDMVGEVTDYYYVQPGDDVQVTFPSAGNNPRAINEWFTVVDFYESKMSEYDGTFAFVALDKLQKCRGMIDPLTGMKAVSSIQLKLRPGADLNGVRDKLRAEFPLEMALQVNSWRDLQGPLLAAVQMETTILNILLFLIIAVAGFGILATFFMIVVEKTKDVGILKSLGASGSGVASIFVGYGVLLGAVGAGAGGVAGLLFVANINRIAGWLEQLTGQEVFDPTVYYFESIPTLINPWTVAWVIVGAIMIAVMASVLPAIRAARMHPVEALRYE